MKKVYVGGNINGFEEHRRLVEKVIRQFDMIPMMLPSVGGSVLDAITRDINEADIFISIMGRYGSVLDDNGVAYNEHEYDIAVGRKIPCFMYFASDKHPPYIKKEEHIEQYKRFKQKVFVQSSGEFDSPEDLQWEIIQRLAKLERQMGNGGQDALIFVPKNTPLVSIEELIGAVRDDGIRKRFERQLTDLKSQVGLESERVKDEVTKRLQGEHAQQIQDVEAKKDSEIQNLRTQIVNAADKARLEIQTQLQAEHRQALADNTTATEKKKDNEFENEHKGLVKQITTLEDRLRKVTGIFVGIIGVIAVFAVPRLTNMVWLDVHPSRDGLYLGAIVIVIGISVWIAYRNWRGVVITSILIGTVLAIITILGRIGSVPSTQ
ncbi:MAG: DUF4062 domain-containing protein [Chloroflexi bacterium]|nr:DUF4062 domain-containing protein [Chloroflexota bacterium]